MTTPSDATIALSDSDIVALTDAICYFNGLCTPGSYRMAKSIMRAKEWIAAREIDAQRGEVAAGVGFNGMTEAETSATASVYGLTQPTTPPAVEGELSSLVNLWRTKEVSDEPDTEFDLGCEQTFSECSHVLERHLAAASPKESHD